ncbi:MAG TPA: hypothetical protein VJ824_08610 [Bacillota bacterium]|nr:hypothetical protein [Bacillota bacterium]
MKKHGIRMLLFFTGLWSSAIGVNFILRAQNIGLDPWDVFFYGVSKQVSLSFGSCVQIIGGICLLCTILYTKKPPKFGTWLMLLLYGRCIDLLVKTTIIPTSTSLYMDYFYLVCGIITVGLGSGMYISAKWGAGPIDGFTQMISKITRINLGKVYIYLAILVALLGSILGGHMTLFTIVYSIAVGPIIQRTYKYCKKIEFLQRTKWKKEALY